MTRLEKLYSSIQNLEELGLELTPEMLLECDRLEEQIIKDELLPALGKDIEPQLRQIKRPLVLVVEYTPEKPISVKLSRKMNISEMLDAKLIMPPGSKLGTPVTSSLSSPPVAAHEPTKHVVNHTRGFRVVFTDGTEYCERAAVDTMIMSLRKIGFDRVAASGIMHSGYGLVSKEERPPQENRIWQHRVDDWYIYTNISNMQKKEDLEKLSQMYNLGLIVEDV